MFTRSNRIVIGILALCAVGLAVAYFAGAFDSAPPGRVSKVVLDSSTFPTPPGIRLLHFTEPFARTWKEDAHAEELVRAEEGGKVGVGEGRAEVRIPGGALAENTRITLDIPESDIAEVECGPDGIRFGAPVALTISYEGMDLTGVDEGSLVVLWLNPGTKQWESQGGRVDVDARRVTADIRHFSRYSLGGSDVHIGADESSSGAMAHQGSASLRLTPTAVESMVMSMKRDIEGINPDVFNRVEVALAGDRRLIEKLGEDGLCRFQVEKIDIHVASGVWDAMQSQKKVDLLDTMVLLLKRQYPNITPFVNLKFDDRRQDLRLKCESPATSG